MTVKIVVSLPEAQVEAARQAVVEGRAPSVSAYIAESMRMREHERSLTTLLNELDDELGPPDEAAVRWADQQLGLG